jgi:error-prone DNA polymerase
VYALYAYRAAFLKAHVPAEYMTAVMNNHTGMYPRSAYIEEARRLGVNILPPCIHTSGIECSAEGNSLRVGLQEIKGLSLSAMERIVRERGQHTFESPLDFFARVSLSLPEAENLVLCGALDEWKIPRPSLVWLCRNLRPAGSMFGDPVRYPDLPDYSWEKKLEYEYNVLGFICGGHPLLFLKQQKEFRPCLDLASLDSRIDEEIQAAGLGLTARSYSTSRGQVMGFMTIEDETGVAEVTLRSDVYAAHRRIIYSQGPFRIRGTVRRRYGDVSIEAEEIEHISVF